jgi:hypothetical protein
LAWRFVIGRSLHTVEGEANSVSLGREGTDDNKGVPAERIAQGLGDLLSVAASQLASSLRPTHIQHTRDPDRSEIRAIAGIGHVELAEAEDVVRNHQRQGGRGHLDQWLGLHRSSESSRLVRRFRGPGNLQPKPRGVAQPGRLHVEALHIEDGWPPAIRSQHRYRGDDLRFEEEPRMPLRQFLDVAA